MTGLLRHQLHWWAHALRSKVPPSSFFWDRQPDTPLIVSDASGEDGWGVCVMGLHIVGPWPAEWRQSAGASSPSMLFKELLAPSVAVLLLAPLCRGKVFAAASDNAGTAFVLNSLSCGCPLSLELLRPLAASIESNHLGLVGGHAHRCHNVHADDLSHALHDHLWAAVLAQAKVKKSARMEVHFVVHDLWEGGAFAATISFARPIRPHVKGVSAASCPGKRSAST